MFNLARTWGVRPSSLVDLEDPYEAYCFDSAVAEWGLYVQGELDKVEGKNAKQVNARRRGRLEALLREPGKGGGSGFADPAARLAKKD